MEVFCCAVNCQNEHKKLKGGTASEVAIPFYHIPRDTDKRRTPMTRLIGRKEFAKAEKQLSP